MHSYKGSWEGGEGERGWGELSIQFETCNKELAWKLSQCASHFSWWALITRWSQKKRVCAGHWRGTNTSRSAWGSRVMVTVSQQQVQWGRHLRQGPQYQCHKPTEAPWPLHLPNSAVIIISLAMHLFLTPLFSAECVLVQNVFIEKYRRLIKKERHCCAHCPLSVHLLFSRVCLCVCVAFLFKASAFLGVGGKKEGRQQLFRKAASSVKFTKYHQHCWTNE